MATITITFNTDDADDRAEYYRMTRANDMAGALWEMMYNTKKGLEYELDDFDGKKEKEMTAYDMLDRVYEQFWEILKDHDLNVDKLHIVWKS
jgi:hypothetical protein